MIDWDNLPVRTPERLEEQGYVAPEDFVAYMAYGYNGVVFVQLLDVPGQPVDGLCDAWVTFASDQPTQAVLYWKRLRGDEACLHIHVYRIEDDIVYAESPIYGRMTILHALRHEFDGEDRPW